MRNIFQRSLNFFLQSSFYEKNNLCKLFLSNSSSILKPECLELFSEKNRSQRTTNIFCSPDSKVQMKRELMSIDGTLGGQSSYGHQALIQSHNRRNGRTVAEKQFRIPNRQPMNWSLPSETNHRQQSKISMWMVMDYTSPFFLFFPPRTKMDHDFRQLIKDSDYTTRAILRLLYVKF